MYVWKLKDEVNEWEQRSWQPPTAEFQETREFKFHFRCFHAWVEVKITSKHVKLLYYSM